MIAAPDFQAPTHVLGGERVDANTYIVVGALGDERDVDSLCSHIGFDLSDEKVHVPHTSLKGLSPPCIRASGPLPLYYVVAVVWYFSAIRLGGVRHQRTWQEIPCHSVWRTGSYLNLGVGVGCTLVRAKLNTRPDGGWMVVRSSECSAFQGAGRGGRDGVVHLRPPLAWCDPEPYLYSHKMTAK